MVYLILKPTDLTAFTHASGNWFLQVLILLEKKWRNKEVLADLAKINANMNINMLMLMCNTF